MAVYDSRTISHFWSGVDIRGDDECWPWRRGLTAQGYGQIRINGKRIRTHRIAWEISNGAIPDGLVVCHSCDVRYAVDSIENRRCCNPAHLWIGTNQENTFDRTAKKRHVFGVRSPNSKLDDCSIVDILSSSEPHAVCARRYRVAPKTVISIRTRKTWTHVPFDGPFPKWKGHKWDRYPEAFKRSLVARVSAGEGIRKTAKAGGISRDTLKAWLKTLSVVSI